MGCTHIQMLVNYQGETVFAKATCKKSYILLVYVPIFMQLLLSSPHLTAASKLHPRGYTVHIAW